MTVRYDVLALGNAVVDVLARTEEDFLAEHGIAKGGMTLIDDAQAQRLYRAMGPTVEASGGSAANTVAGLAALGGTAGFIGRVGDDQFGRVFRHDIESLGIDFLGPQRSDGMPTACCYILVTPDAERSMQTFLGASTEVEPADLDEAALQHADWLYLEGYLWDKPAAKQALAAAAERARRAGAKVALSLSDPFCVQRHGDSFRQLIAQHIDLLLGNSDELKLLYGRADADAALESAAAAVPSVAMTEGADGVRATSGGRTVQVPAYRPAQLIDTTGAGDQFAAGFLYGQQRGLDLADCARLGALAASEVLDHMGPRPQRSVAQLAAGAGLL